MAVREFDGVDDYVEMAVGAASQTHFGACSIAMLIKVGDFANGSPVYGSKQLIPEHSTFEAEFFASGMYWGLENTHVTMGDTTVGTGKWLLIVFSRVAGSGVTPRRHMFDLSTSTWFHGDGSGTHNNGTAALAYYHLGRWGGGAGTDYANMRAAVLGVFPKSFTDAAIEAAGLHTALQNWINEGAHAVWPFNQATVAEGVTDATGGGADQTAIAGTTVITNDDPPGFDFTLGGGAVTGAAALSASGTLAVSGRATSSAGAALSASGTLTATGQGRSSGAVSLSAGGTLTANGRAVAKGAAALSADGTMSASTGSTKGAAAMSASGTMTISAQARALATVAMAAAATLTAAGTARSAGAAALSSSGTLTVTAAGRAFGAAVLSALGTLTASGRVPEAVPPHPETLTLSAVADTLTLTAVPDILTLTPIEGDQMATKPQRVKRGDAKTVKWDLDRDLTGVTTARVLIAATAGGPPIVDRNGSMNNPTPADGIVSLALQPTDYGTGKLEAGHKYLVEVETSPGPLTHPDSGYETLEVVADLG